jgi:hypothetical protein
MAKMLIKDPESQSFVGGADASPGSGLVFGFLVR